MTYVVHSLKTPSYRVKMAGFDFDGTLVFPKGDTVSTRGR